MVNYFAEIDNENIVQKVIVVESAELATQLLGGTWVQTYMSDNKRLCIRVEYER